MADTQDHPFVVGDISEDEVGRVVAFLEGRPRVDALDRRLSDEEVSDLSVISKDVVNGTTRFEVTAKAELHDSTANLVVIYIEESGQGLRVTWIGESVIDADE